jgi:GTP-binding protein
MAKKKQPKVVIFGRTNVGKSTLFNCLTEKNRALVSDISGTTRDSNIGEVNWQNNNFKIIDTGGIIDVALMQGKVKDASDIDTKVQIQASNYLKNADLILFLVDTRNGLLPTDKEMALSLKKIIKDTSKVLLVANKADSMKLRREIAEFNKLGLGEPFPISAATGSGTGDLLDIIVKKIKPYSKPEKKREETSEDKEEEINISIIGKPNVGKSSLVNSILGEERIIVSPIAHTTREPQDTLLEYKGHKINLIDTAGISRRGRQSAKHAKFKNALEKHSILKSISALKKADIVLFVLDINEELTKQDAKIIDEIFKQQISLIIIANKWDLVEEKDTKAYSQMIYRHFPYAQWVPIQFTSAKTGLKVKKVLDLVLEIDEARKVNLGDNALSRFLNRIVKKHRPVKEKGTKHPHIYELTQTQSNPPKFKIRIGAKDTIHDSYVRFIENRLREKFGFPGTPIYIGIEKNRLIHGKAEEATINQNK